MLEVSTYVGLNSLPEQYTRLFDEASQFSFFLSLPWFRNLESTVLGPDEFVQIIGVARREAGNAAVGALVLKSIRPPSRFLSRYTIDSLTTYYTSYFAPVVARACDDVEEISRLFARELEAIRPRWDVLNIRPVDLSQAAVGSLCTAFNDLGLRTQTYFCFGNWYLRVESRSYAEYFKDLPNVIRKNVPYYQRRIEKSARVKIKVCANFEDLEVAIRDYEFVYNSSWRDSEAYPGFVRGLIRMAADQGWLRIGVYYIDEEPAAAQIWLVHGGVASIYKVCYAEKFAKSSVGSVLTAYMLEHAIDADKVKEVDYLSGDDNYKANWMSDRRERWGIMAFNPKTVWGNAGIARHIGGQSLKAKSKFLINEIHSFKWLNTRLKA